MSAINISRARDGIDDWLDALEADPSWNIDKEREIEKLVAKIEFCNHQLNSFSNDYIEKFDNLKKILTSHKSKKKKPIPQEKTT